MGDREVGDPKQSLYEQVNPLISAYKVAVMCGAAEWNLAQPQWSPGCLDVSYTVRVEDDSDGFDVQAGLESDLERVYWQVFEDIPGRNTRLKADVNTDSCARNGYLPCLSQ